ncbi:MAG: class I adenylate-forming enzyme family protein [Panacagrimonas sp.]
MSLPTSTAGSLFDAVRQGALRDPAAPAFILPERLITHRQWWGQICATTLQLHRAGIGPGQRIGVSLGGSPRHCAVLVALSRLGAVSVPLDIRRTAAETTAIAARFGVQRVISEVPESDTAGLPILVLAREALDDPGASESDLTDARVGFVPDRRTPLRIALTSGTTGEPQGVLHSHGELLDRTERTLWGCDGATRLLPPANPGLTIAFIFTMGVLGRGGAVVISRSHRYSDQIAVIRQQAVTHWLISPSAAAELCGVLPPELPAFPSLRHLRIVGAMPSEALLHTLFTRFSPNVFIPYGLTELGVISLATPETLAQSPTSAGRVQDCAEVQVLDGQGHPVPHGVSGELRVRARPMPTGYENDPDASARRFRDGWFHPGDLGRLSADGLLYIEGRIDDVINLGGRKILPGHIERVLLRHPDIRDAVVFAYQLAQGPPRLGAALLLHTERASPRLTARFGAELGRLEPHNYFVLKEFPRNASGKVLRAQFPAIARRLLDARGAASKHP